jgi:hypothetical protein
MKKLHIVVRLVVALATGTLMLQNIPAARAGQNVVVAQLAGEWTKCVAWSGGKTFNIVNGGYNREACFNLGHKCTGNPNATITFYGNPVVVNAPYTRCVAR